jgi:transposase
MVMLGADTHKCTRTIVAIDEVGRRLNETTVPATPSGHRTLLSWAEQFSERRWALEDVRHLSRRLEADLLRAGEHVVRAPTRLMGEARRAGRKRGKADPIDALATARAAQREPDLSGAFLDGEKRELHLLVDHREDSVATQLRPRSHRRRPGACRGARTDLPAPATRLGDTKTEAIRVLRRRIYDEVFRRLLADESARSATAPDCTPVAA